MKAKTIKVEKIPNYEGRDMARMIFKTIESYFMDPEHQREFEIWQQERNSNIRRFPA